MFSFHFVIYLIADPQYGTRDEYGEEQNPAAGPGGQDLGPDGHVRHARHGQALSETQVQLLAVVPGPRVGGEEEDEGADGQVDAEHHPELVGEGVDVGRPREGTTWKSHGHP